MTFICKWVYLTDEQAVEMNNREREKVKNYLVSLI